MTLLRNLYHHLFGFRCSDCRRRFSTRRGCAQHERQCVKALREICGGSLHVAVDRQGEFCTTGAPTDGECGFCHERVGIDNAGRCVVHPVRRPKALRKAGT